MTAAFRLDLEPVAGGEQLAVLGRLVCSDADGSAEFGGFTGRRRAGSGGSSGPIVVLGCAVDGVAAGFIDADNEARRIDLAYFVIASHPGSGVATRAVARVLASGA